MSENTYVWKHYESTRVVDIRAFPSYHDASIARIHSDDNKVFKLWIPSEPGIYSHDATVLETDDTATADDLKNLAALLLALQGWTPDETQMDT